MTSVTALPVAAAKTDATKRARAVGPAIAAVADEIERNQEIPEPVLGQLHESRIYRMLLPRSVGGDQLDCHLRELNWLLGVVGDHYQDRQQLVLTVLNSEDTRFGRSVVWIESNRDVFISMVVVRRIAERRLYLRHGELFCRQAEQRHGKNCDDNKYALNNVGTAALGCPVEPSST